jgi:hypothetical protein
MQRLSLLFLPLLTRLAIRELPAERTWRDVLQRPGWRAAPEP